jgi:hypothetical protein
VPLSLLQIACLYTTFAVLELAAGQNSATLRLLAEMISA